MIDAFGRKPLGGSNERRIEGYRPRVAEVNAQEKELASLSDDALRARSEEFKQQLADRPLNDKSVNDKLANDVTVRTRRNEHDRHDLAAGVRARSKSASLAARPPAKGSEG
jgi:preprotein translocase subunit SecA